MLYGDRYANALIFRDGGVEMSSILYWTLAILEYLINQLSTILQSIDKSFSLICTTQAAAEVKYGVVIFQWEVAEIFLQFLEAFADLRWVGFVGFCVGLVKLIQDSFAIGVAQI